MPGRYVLSETIKPAEPPKLSRRDKQLNTARRLLHGIQYGADGKPLVDARGGIVQRPGRVMAMPGSQGGVQWWIVTALGHPVLRLRPCVAAALGMAL